MRQKNENSKGHNVIQIYYKTKFRLPTLTDIIWNIQKIKVDGFPHGIDINHEYNLLGFTSYTTSSAYILSLNCI